MTTSAPSLRAIAAVQETACAIPPPSAFTPTTSAGLAVANSLAAVEAGVWQVQGCVNGYGERCGNADILTILANLKIKMGLDVVEDEQLARPHPKSRTTSPSWPTWCPTAARPTSAHPPSPTRPATTSPG